MLLRKHFEIYSNIDYILLFYGMIRSKKRSQLLRVMSANIPLHSYQSKLSLKKSLCFSMACPSSLRTIEKIER